MQLGQVGHGPTSRTLLPLPPLELELLGRPPAARAGDQRLAAGWRACRRAVGEACERMAAAKLRAEFCAPNFCAPNCGGARLDVILPQELFDLGLRRAADTGLRTDPLAPLALESGGRTGPAGAPLLRALHAGLPPD